MSRILIIASYNGPRRWSLPNSRLLELQHEYLSKVKHNLDKIVVVQNRAEIPQSKLHLFADVLHRENSCGSYGAWVHGYQIYPDYEWYFFLEDDYIFTLDNFDQRMIDMWDDETSYLCSLILQNPIRHAAISNGLTRGDVLKNIDFKPLKKYDNIYNGLLQTTFSQLFSGDPKKKLKDVTTEYSTPFWQQNSVRYNEKGKPILISPAQLLTPLSFEQIHGMDGLL